MATIVNRMFRLRTGETLIVVTLGLLLLANSLALELSDVVAVSGFLSQVDASNILIVWAVDMLLIAFTASLQSLFVDRFNRVRFMKVMIIIFAAVYFLLRLMFLLPIPSVINYSLLFLLVEQQWIFFPLIFWILANDIFDMSQTKRLFPFFASWGLVGQLLGLLIAAVSPGLLHAVGLSSAELLTFIMVIYLLCYVVLHFGLKNIRVRHTLQQKEPVREALTEGWGFIREVMSFRYLMVAVLAISIVMTVVDFHFLVVSEDAFSNAPADSFQTFYGLYRLGVAIIAIVIQSALTARIIERENVKDVFLILPIIGALSAGLMLVPGLAAAAGARALVRLTRGSVDEPAQKLLLSFVPEERRGRVSMFMDSYLFAGGVLVGCAVIGAVVFFGVRSGNPNYEYIYLGVAIAAALAAIWSIVQMRIVYDKSLFNWRLKRRQRGGSILDKIV